MAQGDEFPHPVFIGGFGRSGTHAIGLIVGADPRYHLVETEVRMHAVYHGLPDVLEDRIDVDEFVATCNKKFWTRGFKRSQGIHRLIDRDAYDLALDRFRAEFDDDRWRAGRNLMDAVVDPPTRRAGKPAWCELTGRSVIYANTLIRLYPRARFINMVRDGRAIAGGHVQKVDMTDDPLEALDRWAQMIRASHEGISAVPGDSVLQLDLDDLVHNDREGTFNRVLEFLEIEDPEPMRDVFAQRVTAGKAHVGRWRTRMPPQEARKVDRRYRQLIREFRRGGIDWVPEPEPRAPLLQRLREPARA